MTGPCVVVAPLFFCVQAERGTRCEGRSWAPSRPANSGELTGSTQVKNSQKVKRKRKSEWPKKETKIETKTALASTVTVVKKKGGRGEVVLPRGVQPPSTPAYRVSGSFPEGDSLRVLPRAQKVAGVLPPGLATKGTPLGLAASSERVVKSGGCSVKGAVERYYRGGAGSWWVGAA